MQHRHAETLRSSLLMMGMAKKALKLAREFAMSRQADWDAIVFAKSTLQNPTSSHNEDQNPWQAAIPAGEPERSLGLRAGPA